MSWPENTHENRLIAAEEVLANMAEKTPDLGFVRRAVAAIRTWLREHGFRNLQVTDAEIIRDFILPARGWVQRGAEVQNGQLGAAAPAMSRSKGGRAFGTENDTVIADFVNDMPLKRHPDYKAAKAGDALAAVRVVTDLVKESSLQQAREQFGEDAIFVPVQAVESKGMNNLPNALAMHYANALNANVSQGIKQSNKAFHTGADAMERLMNRAEFDGEVLPGRRYVLVDDVTTMGSTLADMAAYIQRNGGQVAGSVVMTNAMRGGKIAPLPKTVKQLEARHGQAIRDILGIDADQLTGPEAQYLIGFKSADEIRTRAARSAHERVARLDAKALPERQADLSPAAESTRSQDDAGECPMFSRVGEMPEAAKGKLAKLQDKVRDLTGYDSIDSFLYAWQDKLIDLKRIQANIRALNGTVSETNDAYRGEELYHKRVAKRTANFQRDELMPLMRSMNEAKVRIEEFERFLHARHAPEANRVMAERNPNQIELDAKRDAADKEVKRLRLQLQSSQAKGMSIVGIQKALAKAMIESDQWRSSEAFRGTEEERLSLSGMTDTEAASIMSGYGPERRAVIDALAARVDRINASTMKTLEDYGLMDKVTLDAWSKTYKHYVPLHRDEANPQSKAHPIGQGFSTKGDAGKRRTGSNEKVTNILGHIAMQREAALTRGEKNNVVKRLYLLASQNPDPELWSLDIPKKKAIDPETGLVKTMVDQGAKMRDNAVALRIGGKDQFIMFNERHESALRLAQAIKNLDAMELDRFTRGMGKLTRWFAAVNTQYNPVFGLMNITPTQCSG